MSILKTLKNFRKFDLDNMEEYRKLYDEKDNLKSGYGIKTAEDYYRFLIDNTHSDYSDVHFLAGVISGTERAIDLIKKRSEGGDNHA